MRFTYDPKTQTISDQRVLGVATFMSFERLIANLKATGGIRPNEEVVALNINEHGIEIIFKEI